MKLENVAEKIQKIPGVTGRFVDIRRGRGDKINNDSTQVIVRFYQDPTKAFDPPQYTFYYDKMGMRNFLHLTAVGHIQKCMRCNMNGHGISTCPKRFCYKCGKLIDKENHICFVQPRKRQSFNFTRQEATPINTIIDSNLSDQECIQDNFFNKKKQNISESTESSSIDITSSFQSTTSYASKVSTPKLKNNEKKISNLQNTMEFLSKGRGMKLRTPPTPPTPGDVKHKKNGNSFFISYK